MLNKFIQNAKNEIIHSPNLHMNFLFSGLEILRQLPGQSKTKFSHIEEFSYSTDRNYFCQPYIGFVPESNEYRNVRKGNRILKLL